VKLLIVDDEPAVIGFLSNVAHLEGDVEVDTASSGEEALAKVVQTNYDLISLDIQMPGTSGLEVLALLRNMCPHGVIAIISGNVGEEELPEIAGCADLIIQKPIALEKFRSLLQGAQQIYNHMHEIRALGEIPVPSYRVGLMSNSGS